MSPSTTEPDAPDGPDPTDAPDHSDPPPSTKVPSPEATGGAGTSFELQVAAIALARLLRGDRLIGLGLPVTRVRLQQLASGAVLDDIVVDGLAPDGTVHTVEYQVKRVLAPVPSNEDFAAIVKATWAAVRSDDEGNDPGAIKARRRMFAIVATPSTALTDLTKVTVLARAHNSAKSFITVLRRATRSSAWQRYEMLRETLRPLLSQAQESLPSVGPTDDELDASAWQLASALHIWQVNADSSGNDVLQTQDRLADLLPPSADAATVYRDLVDIARNGAQRAAAIDLPLLRTELESMGVVLSAAPAHRAAFEALRTGTAHLLDLSSVRIGGRLTLQRRPLRSAVREALSENASVLLTGRPGVGKSMLGRLVAEDLAATGDIVVALNLAGRTTLSGMQGDLRISLAQGLSGAPVGVGRFLLIDGAEQMMTDSGRLLEDILRAVPTTADTAPPWQLLLIARDEAAAHVGDTVATATGQRPHAVTVTDLLDEEVAQVVAQFPILDAVDRNPRAKALLLRRPYLVELLVRAVARTGLPEGLVGEEDVLDMVVDRLVRRDEGAIAGRGLPDDRGDVFFAMGEAAVNNALPVRLDSFNAEARMGLHSDDVITRVRQHWGFSHDILLDYACATRLLSPDGSDLLRAAPAPRRLLRAARLQMQRTLTEATVQQDVERTWPELTNGVAALAEADGPRWSDLPWEAVMHAGASRTVLSELTGALLTDDGAGLRHLLSVAHRRGRRPVTADPGGVVEDGPTPLDPALCGPIVDLLATLGARVPARVQPAALQFTYAYLTSTCAYSNVSGEGLEQAHLLPAAVRDWLGERDYGPPLEQALASLAMLGPHLEPALQQWLLEHARAHPSDVTEPVESPWVSPVLASASPALALRLAGLYYLGVDLEPDRSDSPNDATGPSGPHGQPSAEQAQTGPGGAVATVASALDADDWGDMDDFALDLSDGVRDHSYRFAGSRAFGSWGAAGPVDPAGPFLSLLRMDPVRGLRLVGAVVDAATAWRATRAARQGDPGPNPLVLPTPHAAHTFTGGGETWLWHRQTTAGAAPAMSALAALRQWGIGQARAGESPAQVRDLVLGAGTSLAFASVALSILVDQIDLVTDEIDPFLEHPRVWQLESSRTVHESSLMVRAVADSARLSWTMSNVAMQLVLRGDGPRRGVLTRIGAALIENASELHSADATALARRWALELDVNHYRVSEHDDGFAITVAYPDDVTTALATPQTVAAQRRMRGATLLYTATSLRDGTGDLAEAARIWTEVRQYVLKGPDGLNELDQMHCAAAASLVLAADAGHAVDAHELAAAVTVLREHATHVALLAPPPRGNDGGSDSDDDMDDDDGDPYGRAEPEPRFVRGLISSDGADRSVAVALPVLLSNSELRTRASVTAQEVTTSLQQLAASPYDECRQRLVNAFTLAWQPPCAEDPSAHVALVPVARRLLATAGLGTPKPLSGYRPATLPEPLEDALKAEDTLLEVGSAAYAVALLAVADPARTGQACEHAHAAGRLLEAIVDFDTRVWPARYARRHYARTQSWRHTIDQVLADRILRGDTGALHDRLEAFADQPEQLVGLLQALGQATEAAHVGQLHGIWPDVLNRLLPEYRAVQAPPPVMAGSRPTRPKRASAEEVAQLDDALLLIPPRGFSDWPVDSTVTLALAWVKAFAGQADRAHRIVEFVSRTGLARSAEGAWLVFAVLGEDVSALRHRSGLVVAWLREFLTSPPTDDAGNRGRRLLDQLATDGDEMALSVQRELEAGA